MSAEYARWWKRLSPDERKALVDSGAFRADDPADSTPLDSRARVNGNHFDFQRNEEESFNRVMDRMGSFALSRRLLNETVENVMSDEEMTTNPRVAALDLAGLRLRATLHFLLDGLDDSTDPAMRLHADIIRIVVGEGKPPRMTALARTHNISKAAVSLRCRKLLRRLGLAPSRFMRPEDEVNNMRVASIIRNLDDAPSPATPGKESLQKPSKSSTQSRPRKKEARKPRFSKGSGKAGQPRKNKRK